MMPFILRICLLCVWVCLTSSADTSVLGSSYGGWIVDIKRLNRKSIVYSFGLGKDISFDLSLLEKTNCSVYGFDNTPISSAYLRKQVLPPNFHWIKSLLWHNNTMLTMALPRAHGVSMTAGELEGVKDGRFQHTYSRRQYSLRARTLATIMEILEHKHVDLLKIDIEGAEFPIVKAWAQANENIPACQLLMETHERFFAKDGEHMLNQLKAQLEALGFRYVQSKGDYEKGVEWLWMKDSECEMCKGENCFENPNPPAQQPTVEEF
uniref:Methyltransferase FkbM domain-containing protein n=1 Tax=Eutreptiella gymnastica TaxID=73025 RepID=A0A7S4LCK0_9EUGL|mmetsp:Transcript_39271/g.63826  ORF Transcript_39271/g.63826 Transcript_39271/m.63826 type:complete len:265 (-) Transcript_39271:26-820(-)|eukprot:CAMPEP_0174357398 /NCGR_PEP_ID=MMETSP0811_2-20130205/35888_1 /TAXON_ID=73025 ORGANISM="Eutreptiella gymnastica-like, Strain CCMP1594" /NCGR_SAMPLE_ID=MMETSP0811_2 /ASSEMBLY_ACC=CAM_ASM_000667 /LENGTH=264 /DNA_ID=CAMNT_0015490193 /DNA_START=51 /DNA_END=845 /DNA_ORIENTATION=+